MKFFSLNTKFFFPKNQKNYLIDAKNKILGRFCSSIVKIIIGKNSPFYTPNFNNINKILIINAKKIKLDKKKKKKKIYFKYTGYIGNKKKYNLEYLFKKNPSLIIKKSIFRMLPKNKLGKYAQKKIYIQNDNKIKKYNLKFKKYKFN